MKDTKCERREIHLFILSLLMAITYFKQKLMKRREKKELASSNSFGFIYFHCNIWTRIVPEIFFATAVKCDYVFGSFTWNWIQEAILHWLLFWKFISTFTAKIRKNKKIVRLITIQSTHRWICLNKISPSSTSCTTNHRTRDRASIYFVVFPFWFRTNNG